MLFKKVALISALAASALLSAGSAYSQTCDCKPREIIFNKDKTVLTPYKPDFQSTWQGKPLALQTKYEDSSADKHFQDTINWNRRGQACNTSKVTVSWTLRNMSANGLQSNDTTSLVFMGKSITGTARTVSLAPNQEVSFTHVLSGAEAKHGRVSLSVQDDTAVKEFKVNIEQCCITPDNAGRGDVEGPGPAKVN